jgi:ubiquitin-conjugating enzyme E2 variant
MTGSASERISRPHLQRGLEATALGLVGVLLSMLLMRLSRRVDGAGAAAVAGAAVAAGYTVADLVSGVVHWFCDRAFGESTPLIGPLFIKPFREHHRDPFAMTQHGLLELLGNSAVGALPVLAFAWWCMDSLFADALMVAFGLGVIASNVFHAWAHVPRPPPVVAWLQARWLVLPPAHHARHHRPGHDVAYCMTTGWMNGWTDGLGVFLGLERVLRALRVPTARAQ